MLFLQNTIYQNVYVYKKIFALENSWALPNRTTTTKVTTRWKSIFIDRNRCATLTMCRKMLCSCSDSLIFTWLEEGKKKQKWASKYRIEYIYAFSTHLSDTHSHPFWWVAAKIQSTLLKCISHWNQSFVFVYTKAVFILFSFKFLRISLNYQFLWKWIWFIFFFVFFFAMNQNKTNFLSIHSLAGMTAHGQQIHSAYLVSKWIYRCVRHFKL